MTGMDLEEGALEARLQAFRPTGPPDRLRGVVLGAGTGRPAGVSAPLALALLLLLALTLRWSARSGLVADSPWAGVVPEVARPSELAVGIEARTVEEWLRSAKGSRPRRQPIGPLLPGSEP